MAVLVATDFRSFLHVSILQLGCAVSLLYKFESKSQTRKSTDAYSPLISAATNCKRCILKLAFLQIIRTEVSIQTIRRTRHSNWQSRESVIQIEGS